MMFDGIMSTNSGSSMEHMQVATKSNNDTCKHIITGIHMLHILVRQCPLSLKPVTGSTH